MIRTFLGCFVLLAAAVYAEDAKQAGTAPQGQQVPEAVTTAKTSQTPAYFSEKALAAKTTAESPAAGITAKKTETAKTAAEPAKKAEPSKPAPQAVKPVETDKKPEAKKSAAGILEEQASLPGIPANKKHKVADGDTLWAISDKYYGDPFKWGKIYNFNLNLIKNPDLIYPDSEIEIPDIKEMIVPEMKQPAVSSGAQPLSVEREEPAALDPDAGKEAAFLPGQPSEDEVIVSAVETKEPAVVPETDPEPEMLPEAEETVDPLELSEKMPEGQLTFATMSKTLKVDKRFFEGEVLEKDTDDEMEKSGFIQPGDTLKVKIYSPENSAPGDKLAVYQKGVETGGQMTVQYVGTLKIISIDGKKASCRVLKVNTAVDGTMYVRKLSQPAKKGN